MHLFLNCSTVLNEFLMLSEIDFAVKETIEALPFIRGVVVESLELYSKDCRTYEKERKELREKTGWRKMRILDLLGNPKIVKDTLEYVEKTGRLKLAN